MNFGTMLCPQSLCSEVVEVLHRSAGALSLSLRAAQQRRTRCVPTAVQWHSVCVHESLSEYLDIMCPHRSAITLSPYALQHPHTLA